METWSVAVFPEESPGDVLVLGSDRTDTASVLTALGYGVSRCGSSASGSAAADVGASGVGSLGSAESRDVLQLVHVVLIGYRLSEPPLALFNGLRERLAPGGRANLIVSRQSNDDLESAAYARRIGYLRAIAARCGFVSDREPEARSHPQSAQRRCLSFVRADRDPRWRVMVLPERDVPRFVGLFKSAFNQDIDVALWRWKYGDGRGDAIIAETGGRLVAHYGCTRRRVRFFGEPIVTVQICDVMVDPRERGIMTKSGAMFLTAATFAEIFLGLQGVPLGYGFPSRRHERLAETLGLYAEVGRLMEVRWPGGDTRARLASRVRHLDPEQAGDRRAVERLWSAMARDFEDGVLAIRDWSYIAYRYAAHPLNHYELLLVTSRLTGRPLGLLVLRKGNDAVELVDLVAPRSNLPVLVDQARRLTALWGLPSVFCWITQQHVSALGGPDGEVKDLDISIPTSVWVDGPAPERLRDRWWLMSGDTDFH
ncbi:GNAT family N-acetyltransferase [Thiocapsa bogorovii]|uniref:GNAT family N-acetyltransferase n=1 Tax=Thiocapsa bogorovii TaxID=521689 RepID=UPI001E3CD735|nr:GNAT family N-acetyltransferase [Thiocapsa bogorovii]UHD14532.1 GNAT family N-acetyltransferase [Thiocapsa bogorovii]